MRIVHAALALGGLALVQAKPHIDKCNPGYQCVFHYIDETSTVEYSWDFRGLCRGPGQEYFYRDSVGQNYTFQICGNVSVPCLSRGAINPAAHGVMVQTWGNGPFVNPACKADTCGLGNPLCCEDREYPGAYGCCTQGCEVIAHTRPEFDLIDPSNPATGGILLLHNGMMPVSGDPAGCPPDPITNYPAPRTLAMRLFCDPTMFRNDIRVTALVENPTCYYTMDIFTGAACGVLGDPFDPPNVTTTNPSTNFGFTVLGAFLTIGCGLFIDQANKRGWTDALKSKIAAQMGGSSGGGMRVSVTTTAATGAGGESSNAFGGDSRSSNASTPFGGGGYGSL